MDTNAKKLLAGARVGNYEIRSHVGTGGMAEVYRAVHVATGQEVALKALRSSARLLPQASSRFAHEVLAISAARHRNVVAILEVDLESSPPFLAMEYVPGRTLRSILDEEGPLPLDQVLSLGVQIAEGLRATHEAGIVHRDLKPENVMVTPDGRVKILDFGLSKSLRKRDSSEDSLTLPGMILGTLAYMSPEQASARRADFRADQFALGAILYEMTTGVAAFQRETIPKTLGAVLTDEPAGIDSFRASAPPDVREVVERALAKTPDDRYASMVSMKAALAASSLRHRQGFLGRALKRAASVLRKCTVPSPSSPPARRIA
jgi:serine/threonine protein kinase